MTATNHSDPTGNPTANPSVSHSLALPTISLAKLSTPTFREEELLRLREITHTIGFFYLTDHGIPEELAQRLFSASAEFFARPQQEKLGISNTRSRHYRGYSYLGEERTQGKVDWREQIDIAKEREPVREGLAEKPWLVLEGPNTWDESTAELRTLTEDWIEHCSEVSRILLRSWAESLRADPEIFVEDFDVHHSAIKLAHYPAEAEQRSTQGVGAHRDAGVLTLLRPEPGSTGLQVLKGEKWTDVPTVPGTFIVNIGELLEYATDGYLVATPHRVLPSTENSRLSIPFFYHPGLDSAFPRLNLDADLAAESKGVRTDLSGEEIFEVSGRNILKSRVRAYPEITRKYHPELLDEVS